MEPELKDFSKSDEFSDLILVVEDKKLHVHRVYLAEWSPVFRQMFIQQSAKKNFKTTKKIPLPGKKYEEITEMLHCIYSSQKAITDSNVKFLLQLANEYQIAKLVQRCEEYLLTKDMTVESLAMAQHYGLERLESAALSSLKHKTIQEMETCEGYSVLSSGTVAQLYKVRGEHLEQTLKNIYHVWKGLDVHLPLDVVTVLRKCASSPDLLAACNLDSSDPPLYPALGYDSSAETLAVYDAQNNANHDSYYTAKNW